MNVCMYVCMYVCMHVCMFVCEYIYMYMHIRMYMCVCVCVCESAYIYKCICIYIKTHIMAKARQRVTLVHTLESVQALLIQLNFIILIFVEPSCLIALHLLFPVQTCQLWWETLAGHGGARTRMCGCMCRVCVWKSEWEGVCGCFCVCVRKRMRQCKRLCLCACLNLVQYLRGRHTNIWWTQPTAENLSAGSSWLLFCAASDNFACKSSILSCSWGSFDTGRSGFLECRSLLLAPN